MSTKNARSRGMPRRSEPAGSRPTRTPLIIGVGVAVVVGVAAIVAIAMSTTASGGVAEPARTAIQVSGTPLPELTASGADPALGMPIPTLTGVDLDGAPISIGPSDGPMAIVVLAHWCSHCQAEVPVLVDYLESTGMPSGVRLVAVSTSIDPARPNYPPSAWLEREGWTASTMVDDASSGALRALGMTSFPGFVMIDAAGRVVQRSTGEMPVEAFASAVRAMAP